MVFSATIVATVLAYTWWLEPITPRWTAALAACVVLGIAIARALKTREWGVARSQFVPALRPAVIFTAIASAAVVAIGLRRGTWHARPSIGIDFAALVPWALGQQFALHTVLLREAQTTTTRAAGVVIAALLFAALHLPNAFLAASTLAAALAWCRIYDRHPNLLPLALSHAALTLVVLCAFDDSVTGRLRVGVSYLSLR